MLSLAVFVTLNANAPSAVLLFAVVPEFKEFVPTAVLLDPVAFDCNDTNPNAVLFDPEVFENSAFEPTAELNDACPAAAEVPLLNSAESPTATKFPLMVLLYKVAIPIATLE